MHIFYQIYFKLNIKLFLLESDMVKQTFLVETGEAFFVYSYTSHGSWTCLEESSHECVVADAHNWDFA